MRHGHVSRQLVQTQLQTQTYELQTVADNQILKSDPNLASGFSYVAVGDKMVRYD